MKAVVYKHYGSPEVLQLTELAKPTPKNHEVLIKICATTVHVGDTRMRKPDPFMARFVNGLLKPRRIPVLGLELAGVVEETGQSVTRFEVGDEVFAFTGFRFGAYAQYICLSGVERKGPGLVAHKPANLSLEEAAALPGGGLTALSLIRKAKLKKGQSILIYGASGSVGTYAVQLAAYAGAGVTGVCSTANLELVKSLGATSVIDYTWEDFLARDEKYDVVLDAVDKLPKSEAKKVLKTTGRYLNVGKDSGSTKPSVEGLEYLKALVEMGDLRVAVDRSYSLDEIVEAHRYVELGHKKGNVVVSVI